MILLYICFGIAAAVLWLGMLDFFLRPWIMRKTWGREPGGSSPVGAPGRSHADSARLRACEPSRLQDHPDWLWADLVERTVKTK